MNEFARKWSFSLIFGLCVYIASKAIEGIVVPLIAVNLDFPSLSVASRVIFSYGMNSAFLILMFLEHRRLIFSDIYFAGNIKCKFIFIGAFIITVVYVAEHILSIFLSLPREPTIDALFKGKSTADLITLVCVLLLLPPIAEELAFRHFLISIFPYKSNKYIAIFAALSTSIYFSLSHSYINTESYVVVFIVGMVLCFYRIKTNGILTSIVLHSYAIGVSALMAIFL
ncbi:CPBP family intramembrane metalloprotease [Burkholderia sp. 9775_39]|uniref:CPBP family intramembrane glutamic endopeptidase n=1 Tax=unclassified Burkholderia TaxID=2613784 RepID=UPI0018C3B2E1|nr:MULTISPECIES: CPBP family intramembrane glutamic endopeptidase [unclassified Burkholderia]MBG0881278.1 CPBP family intramembrane metalloprotease [Burkholderia sp. 9775_39]MBG0887645.1 CPBP family intramembrane metalloprotease [Burkholderia sp. 9773_38]